MLFGSCHNYFNRLKINFIVYLSFPLQGIKEVIMGRVSDFLSTTRTDCTVLYCTVLYCTGQYDTVLVNADCVVFNTVKISGNAVHTRYR